MPIAEPKIALSPETLALGLSIWPHLNNDIGSHILAALELLSVAFWGV